MGTEIERKFLVQEGPWRSEIPVSFRQGYLTQDRSRTVRVRIAGTTGFLTIKGPNIGASRLEYEYNIPHDDAIELLDQLCIKPIIEKKRYKIIIHGKCWEVDEFFGDNEGLLLAEIELDHENEEFDPPDWVGREVTTDERYFNSNLAQNPFCNWRD